MQNRGHETAGRADLSVFISYSVLLLTSQVPLSGSLPQSPRTPRKYRLGRAVRFEVKLLVKSC
jgi:hypothetical protein